MRLMLTVAAMCLALPVAAADVGFLPEPNESVLMLSGKIEKGDAARFRSALASRHVYQRIVLDSPGGDFSESIEIAEAIYMAGLATIAPMTDICTPSEDSTCVCAASCFFIWAAGRPRFGNAVLIRSPFDAAHPANRAKGAAATALIQSTLRKFGVPEMVVQAVIDTPFQSPRRLTEEELQAMQPFTYVPDDEPDKGKVP